MHAAIAVLVLAAQEDVLPVLNVVETTAAVPAAVRHRVRIAAIDAVHHPIRVREVVIVDAIREEGKHPFLYQFLCFFLSLSLSLWFVVCCSLSLSLALDFFLSFFPGTCTHIYTHATRAYLKLASLYFSCLSKEKRREWKGYTHTHTYTHIQIAHV